MEKMNILPLLRCRDVQRLFSPTDKNCCLRNKGSWHGLKLKVKIISKMILPNIDILLIGLHLAYAYDDLKRAVTAIMYP